MKRRFSYNCSNPTITIEFPARRMRIRIMLGRAGAHGMLSRIEEYRAWPRARRKRRQVV
jgi:hypothetical protein